MRVCALWYFGDARNDDLSSALLGRPESDRHGMCDSANGSGGIARFLRQAQACRRADDAFPIVGQQDDVLAAKTVRITPTAFAETPGGAALSDKQRGLIANAIDRSLCFGLSERFEVVPFDQPADLTAHAAVTHVAATDPTMAGASKLVSLAPAILLPGAPVPVPRVPLGLGSLSIEAQARDRTGAQKAAMIWARGANSFTSAPRVSSDGDAYDLTTSFSGDFSKLLVTGASPFGKLPSPPSLQSMGRFFGAARQRTQPARCLARIPDWSGLSAIILGRLPTGRIRAAPTTHRHPANQQRRSPSDPKGISRPRPLKSRSPPPAPRRARSWR